MKVLPDKIEILKKPLVSGIYVLPDENDIPEKAAKYFSGMKVL